MNSTASTFVSERGARWILLAIVLYALVLRLVGLGRLGFWIDEDLTWLAVDGIFAEGAPRLPSGALYLRSIPYSYLVAGCAWLFGANPEAVTAGALGAGEIAYRLPSVLFSLLTLLVAYAITREVAGRGTALVAAFVLATSPWEIQYAQMARMYALLELLTAIAVLLALRATKRKSVRLWIGTAVVVAVATTVHKLGATLALLPLLWLLLPEPKRRESIYAFSGITGAALGFLFERSWSAWPAFADSSGLEFAVEAGSQSPALTLPVLPGITFNYARVVWYDLLQTSLPAGIVALGCLVLGSALALRWFLRQQPSRSARLAFVALLLALLTNQLVFAIAAACVATKLAPPRNWFKWCSFLAACLAVAVGAAFIGQALAHGPASIGQRSFLRVFFAMPVPFYRMLGLQFPVMFLVVAAGSVWILVRSLAAGTPQCRFLLVAAFWSVLLAIGLFESPYVVHRYVLHLNPAFVAIFSITIVDFALWISRRVRRGAANEPASPVARGTRAAGHLPQGWALAATLAIALVLGEQSDAWQAWKTTTRPYGRADLEDADAGGRFWFDWDGCGEYLVQHAKPEDVVLLKDAVHYYPYGARADYRLAMQDGVWATDPTGHVVDWYLGIPFVRDLFEFESVVTRAQAEGKTCWVAYTREQPEGPVVHLPRDLMDRLNALSDCIVHTGRDGHTVILRLDPDDDVRASAGTRT